MGLAVVCLVWHVCVTLVFRCCGCARGGGVPMIDVSGGVFLQGVLKAVDAGDFGKAATYVRRFREIDAGALADSGEMMEMEEAVKG